MMKTYRVMVNGEAFQVEVEEIGASVSPSTPEPSSIKSVPKEQKEALPKREMQKREVQKPEIKKEIKKIEIPKAAATGAINEVTSPLPGTVLNINAKEGQTVNSGEVVLVIEAMKMENEIVAPEAGTITDIPVKKGDSVQAGDLLFRLG